MIPELQEGSFSMCYLGIHDSISVFGVLDGHFVWHTLTSTIPSDLIHAWSEFAYISQEIDKIYKITCSFKALTIRIVSGRSDPKLAHILATNIADGGSAGHDTKDGSKEGCASLRMTIGKLLSTGSRVQI